MLVGRRTETIEAKNKRHIKEISQDIDGWKNELEYARKKGNTKYEIYCKAMITICENTLEQLKHISFV